MSTIKMLLFYIRCFNSKRILLQKENDTLIEVLKKFYQLSDFNNFHVLLSPMLPLPCQRIMIAGKRTKCRCAEKANCLAKPSRRLYSLEYGSHTLEIHEDAIEKVEKVIIVDDLIATGGTVGATVKLVEKLGADLIECAFVVELPDLKGRDKIPGCKVFSITEFEGE